MTEIRSQRSGGSKRDEKKFISIKVIRLALCASLFALSVPVAAQQPAKVPKIGFLGARPAPASGQELWRELHKLGYVEGKNIAIEFRYADNKIDRLPALADELVRLKVDVLVTPGTNEALAAKNATRTIPIVFVGVGDPVAAGLVDSLARPGENITGFTTIGAVLAGKRLELLKETVPKLSSVAVLWNLQDPGSAQQWKESQLSARELGLQLHSMEVSSADKLESAFKEATTARAAALTSTSSALANSNQKQIADLSDKKSVAGDLPSRRLGRQRWLDVLRTRPGRTLQACSVDGRQDPEGNQASRHTSRATDEV